jgi:hypothetical protein
LKNIKGAVNIMDESRELLLQGGGVNALTGAGTNHKFTWKEVIPKAICLLIAILIVYRTQYKSSQGVTDNNKNYTALDNITSEQETSEFNSTNTSQHASTFFSSEGWSSSLSSDGAGANSSGYQSTAPQL